MDRLPYIFASPKTKSKPNGTHRNAHTDGDGNALRGKPTTGRVISMHIGSPERLMPQPPFAPIPQKYRVFLPISMGQKISGFWPMFVQLSAAISDFALGSGTLGFRTRCWLFGFCVVYLRFLFAILRLGCKWDFSHICFSHHCFSSLFPIRRWHFNSNFYLGQCWKRGKEGLSQFSVCPVITVQGLEVYK